MQITEALIRRFLLGGDCTPEEADLVERYFRENPDKLKKHLQEDWESADHSGPLPSEQTREMLAYIDRQTTGKPPARIRRFAAGAAVAASVALILAGIGLYKGLHHEGKQPLGGIAQKGNQGKEPNGKKSDTANAGVWQELSNTTYTPKKMILPDGSVITLGPGSRIRYRDPFPAPEREVGLTGEAGFNVVPGIAPFRVKTGSLTTTVLGTVFYVREGKKMVTVRLYNGKVSVRAGEKDFILSPGQQLRYQQEDDHVTITHFPHEGSAAQGGVSIHKGSMVFDNAPLEEVMEKLTRRYGVPIRYDRKEVAGKYFTGTVLERDSLGTILGVIANMNGLIVQPLKSGFSVSVSH